MTEISEPRWFVRHRMEWIRETLRIFGFINRRHISRKFELSMPQASADLVLFQKMHPGLMRYDPSAKCYVSTHNPIAEEEDDVGT